VGSAFGVEAGAGCFEGVFEVVVGFAFVGFEAELVCAGVERECEVAQGVDVVFEHTGAETWPGSIAALKKNGRLVTCGATSGFDARTDLRQLFYRHLTLLGSFMGSKAELLDAMKFVESGAIRAVVDQTLPLYDAINAHQLMENRAQFGKLVLIP